MQLKNQAFIETLSIDEVPWARLATPYYRAVEVPELLEAITDGDSKTADEAAELLAANLESESVIWQPAPWALLFLKRILGCAVDSYLKEPNALDEALIIRILGIYAPVFDALEGIDGEHPQPVSQMEALLQPENLLPEPGTLPDKDDDVLVGEFYQNVPENYFYSYFHFAWLILAESLAEDVSRLQTATDAEMVSAANLFLEAPLYGVLKKMTT